MSADTHFSCCPVLCSLATLDAMSSHGIAMHEKGASIVPFGLDVKPCNVRHTHNKLSSVPACHVLAAQSAVQRCDQHTAAVSASRCAQCGVAALCFKRLQTVWSTSATR
eukprot:GHRQ01022810.1.p1 GENE.GHRQ01022810.1~~GHRQ01022810.1.p1  ORF type:complete len:109 (-),score=9.78 GHRQ01022810.1:139-465(-)